MPDYDFHTLSPSDFEVLVCDLLRAKFQIQLESFGHGPDGGVDLRSTTDRDTVIVQCKHYRGSSFSDLKRATRQEKRKMDTHQPDDYYFVTSQDLSLTQKDTLLDELSPHLADTSKLLAMRDLNQILGDFPEVEENHFKLWMASAAVIRRIVDSGIWERSTALMEEIQDRVKLYVLTLSFSAAKNMLMDNHVCVITGAPGVGKSMLADMLALTHWESGWQIVTLASQEISKSWDVWDAEKKQFFYFDDVFGQTDIQERLSNDSGSTLARLIRRIGSASRKRLVITTRTHVMHEAELRDEPIARAGLRARECVVRVQEYGRLHRARVLYNHLYFSSLDRETVRTFVTSSAYWRIIDHLNFTPRIIEQTIIQTENGLTSGSLERQMLESLDHPVLLWGASFREALSETARLTLMHLAAFPTGGAPFDELRAASIRDVSPIEYRRAVAQLEGSWIKIGKRDDQNCGGFVTFHDPSCRDFVLTFLDSEPDYVIDVAQYSTSAVQISQLLRYGQALNQDRMRKFCGIYSMLKENAEFVSEIVRGAWDRESAQQDRLATETLAAIMDADDEYGLQLNGWITKQILNIGSRIEHNPVDADAARQLTHSLMDSGCAPATHTEFASCALLFRAWCYAIVEESDWDRAVDFSQWVESFDQSVADLFDSDMFRSAFDKWLDEELDAVLDNSESRDSAQQWADELELLSRKYFANGEFQNRFNYFHECASEKWERYEPDAEDFGAVRAAGVIERDIQHGYPLVSSQNPRSPSGWRPESPARVNAEIREMFNQLK